MYYVKAIVLINKNVSSWITTQSLKQQQINDVFLSVFHQT